MSSTPRISISKNLAIGRECQHCLSNISFSMGSSRGNTESSFLATPAVVFSVEFHKSGAIFPRED